MQISKPFTAVTWIMIGLLVGGSGRCQAPPDTVTLSLNTCISRALDENIALTASRHDLEANRIRIGQARRAQWPSMSLMLSDNTSLDTRGEYSQYDPATGQSFVAGEGFEAGAEVRYPVFDAGNAHAAFNAEVKAYERDRLDVQITERDIVKQAIEAYLLVLERSAECVVRKEQVAQAEEAVKIARGRLSQGSGIQYEVLLEEAYYAQSIADLLSTENALHQAERALLELLNMEPSLAVELLPLDPSDVIRLTRDEIITIARDHRLEFQRYDAEIDTQKMQLKILRSSRYPRVDLFASVNQQGSGIEDFADGDTYITAGLSLRFSPFSDASLSGSTRREWIESNAFMQKTTLSFDINDGSSILDREIEQTVLIRRLERERARLLRRIEIEIMAAYEDYRGNLAYRDARRKNLEAMDENYRIQLKSNELGINQFKDVVDARADLISARIDLTRSEYATEQSRMNLDHALGLLEYQESYE